MQSGFIMEGYGVGSEGHEQEKKYPSDARFIMEGYGVGSEGIPARCLSCYL